MHKLQPVGTFWWCQKSPPPKKNDTEMMTLSSNCSFISVPRICELQQLHRWGRPNHVRLRAISPSELRSDRLHHVASGAARAVVYRRWFSGARRTCARAMIDVARYADGRTAVARRSETATAGWSKKKRRQPRMIINIIVQSFFKYNFYPLSLQ